MRFSLIAFLAAALVSGRVCAQEPRIRDFDLKTLEALGRELFRRDQLASQGTDLMLETRPEARREPIKGWVSILKDDNTSVVYFLREKDELLTLAYTITFPREGQPVVEDHIGEAVPEAVRARFRARQTARAAIPKLYTRPNLEVIDDPDGDGFLVYVLASTTKPNEIVVGGHYRVTVSADGRTAEQVDALSKSLLILTDPADGTKAVARYATHMVSGTPVETHVFASLLHKETFYIVTMDGAIWEVVDGRITKVQEAEKSPAQEKLKDQEQKKK